MERHRKEAGVELDSELTVQQLESLIEDYRDILARLKVTWPKDPMRQLELSIEAVFHSWGLKRAQTYREAHGIPHDLGTAVNVQMMVFGNMGENSGTGVTFSRDPSTGENEIYGEYLMNAQGEDVVAGIRNAKEIAEMKGDSVLGSTVKEKSLEIAGTCVSMGVKIEGKPPKEMQRLITDGKYDDALK